VIDRASLIFIVTVAVLGVLHTVVPDHWAPIVVLARQRRWSLARTAHAAALAGAALAARYPQVVSLSLERYGEVLSGSFVAAVGVYALFTA
jgi:endonuclease/exonuclease/phosphatase (EEP) superfamily protein YafD